MSAPGAACPYCGGAVLVVDSARVYGGKSYGWAHVCENWPICDAYVGCHQGTKNPLGRLANEELRYAKSAAHKLFDALWREKMKRTACTKKEARSAGYVWLAGELALHPAQCHIGMFDVDKCRRVVEVCGRYFKK